jgi:hypothetical protein
MVNCYAQEELILVGSKIENWKPLSAFELRKLYLGLPVPRDNSNLTPIRNKSDDSLDIAFHKFIVGMQSNSYQRKLLRNQMNYAVLPPAVVDDMNHLVKKLNASPYVVSYAWRSAVDTTDDKLQALQVIWSHQK